MCKYAKNFFLLFSDFFLTLPLVSRLGPEPNLPGLPFTGRQLFWVSGASKWCSVSRPQSIKNQVSTTLHSSIWRVNTTLLIESFLIPSYIYLVIFCKIFSRFWLGSTHLPTSESTDPFLIWSSSPRTGSVPSAPPWTLSRSAQSGEPQPPKYYQQKITQISYFKSPFNDLFDWSYDSNEDAGGSWTHLIPNNP